MKADIFTALSMYGIAAAVSFFVACMVKLIYWTVNRAQRTSKKP